MSQVDLQVFYGAHSKKKIIRRMYHNPLLIRYTKQSFVAHLKSETVDCIGRYMFSLDYPLTTLYVNSINVSYVIYGIVPFPANLFTSFSKMNILHFLALWFCRKCLKGNQEMVRITNKLYKITKNHIGPRGEKEIKETCVGWWVTQEGESLQWRQTVCHVTENSKSEQVNLMIV